MLRRIVDFGRLRDRALELCDEAPQGADLGLRGAAGVPRLCAALLWRLRRGAGAPARCSFRIGLRLHLRHVAHDSRLA